MRKAPVMRRLSSLALMVAIPLLVLPQTALAYIGPGAGITAIGTVIALIGAVLLAIVGFLWYPIKRLRAKRLQANSKQADNTNDSPSTS